jgi:hypothetical protein
VVDEQQPKHSIDAQIKAQRREIAISEKTYSKLVQQDKMTLAAANLQLELKCAILVTLEQVQAQQAAQKGS